MKKLIKNNKAFIILAVTAAFLILALFFSHYAGSPIGGAPRLVMVDIPKGASFLGIVEILEQHGLVKNRPFFYALAIIKKAARHVRAGEYELTTTMSPLQILGKLVRGEIKEYRVTIPEDFSAKEIASRLASSKLIKEKEFFALAADQEFLSSLKIKAPSIEGYLYPDTYLLDRSMGTREIMTIMVNRFWEKITPDMIKKAGEKGMNLTQLVTLASMIGKESGSKDEKDLISAVFHNRLKKGMKLQSDPTAVYDLTRFSGIITGDDLRKNTSHNTYRIKGLPPGPIANPGIDSFYAALYPSAVNYLYFVSKNDGSHQFSTNYAAHSTAVLKYQIDKKKE